MAPPAPTVLVYAYDAILMKDQSFPVLTAIGCVTKGRLHVKNVVGRDLSP